MTASLAADLQTDEAAWKRHSFQMRIDEGYAGIYFLATRKLQNGRHQQTTLNGKREMA